MRSASFGAHASIKLLSEVHFYKVYIWDLGIMGVDRLFFADSFRSCAI